MLARYILLWLALLLANFVVGQPPSSQPETPATPARYILRAGDVVEFKFSFNTDMNDRVTIRPDGYLSLAMIGDVLAGGKTPEQLASDISKRYEGKLKHPEVVAIVREFAAQRIFITGEVNTPGVLPFVEGLTIAQAVSNAGGMKATARINEALLLRYDGANRSSVSSVRLGEILSGTQPDVRLGPFDVIFVPRSRIAKLDLFVEQYINGLVPKSLLFPYNLSNVVTVRQP
jgi:protein involved in polysaccharide export with SLBB domain